MGSFTHQLRENNGAVALTAVLLVAVVAFAFVGPALAQSVETDRTAEETVLGPGETTEVTVDVTLDEPQRLFVQELFDPAFESVEIVDSDGADLGDVTDANDELFADWEEAESVTLVYEVMVPSDATDGETFTIESGESSDVDVDPVTIEVDEDQPFFAVSDLEPGDTDVEPGETVDVSARVNNTGEASGEQTVAFDVDGEVVADETVSLDSGGEQTVDFELTAPEESGSYDYTVASEDQETGATLTVGDGGSETDRAVSSSLVQPGGATTVTVDVVLDQEGDLFVGEAFDPAFGNVELVDTDGAGQSGVTNANDELFASWGGVTDVTLVYEVTVPEDAALGEEFEITSADASDVDLGADTVEVTDERPPEFVFESVDVPANISQGDVFEVNATIANVGNLSGTQTVEYRVADTELASTDVTLDADGTETVTLTVDSTSVEPGTYTQSVATDDETETAPLGVDPSPATYAGDDGTIGIGGLSEALGDWRDGEIGLGTLGEVLSIWRSDEPVN